MQEEVTQKTIALVIKTAKLVRSKASHDGFG